MANERVQFTDFLSRLGDVPPQRAYVTFETLVLRLLEAHATSQHRRILFGGGHIGRAATGEFDATLPEGLDDLPGPGVVEIKYFGSHGAKALTNRLHEFASRLFMAAARQEMRFGLLIHNLEFTDAQRERAAAFLAQLPPTPKVVLWGVHELRELAASLPDVMRDIFKDPLTDASLFAVREELRRNESDWQSNALDALAQVRGTYEREEVSVFLGAGVSMPAGVPSWNELLARLFIILAQKEFEQDVGATSLVDLATLLRELESQTPLLAARYMRSGLESKEGTGRTFQDHLTEILYQDVDPENRGDLLRAVGGLCQPTMAGGRVRSVISFNFDDLLEKELQDREIKHHAVYLPHDPVSVDHLPIFHVHGFLPQASEAYPGVESSLLAFSEEAYHVVYSDPYHWSNLVQLNALRERCCLFIGLSLTDPNLRRLLEIVSTGEKTRHYAFMKRVSIREAMESAGRQDPPLDVPEVAVRSLLRVHHALTDQVLKELDIRVVWYASHTDLPGVIRKIYQ